MTSMIDTASRTLFGSAASSHYTFDIQGLAPGTLAVVGFSSEEHGLSKDYCFTVEVVARGAFPLERAVGAPAVLAIRWAGQRSRVHGVIHCMSQIGESLEGMRYTVELRSPLWPLTQYRHNRVFLGKNVVEIVTEVLTEAGLPADTFVFDVAESYPQREFVVQYEETDFQFISRLLAFDGIFFAFEQGERKAVAVFSDDNNKLAERLGAVHLPYVTHSGQSRSSETVFALRRKLELKTGSVTLKDYNDRTPERRLLVELQSQSGLPSVGNDYRFGEHFEDEAEGERLARLRVEALDWQRDTVIMESDCRGLAPGKRLVLSRHPDAAMNGDWLVLEVDHRGDQGSGHAYGGEAKGPTYSNKLLLIRAATPYRPPLPPRTRHIFGSFTARVEGDGGEYAYVDEDGRYRIRMPFDLSDTQQGEASHPVRLMQPYGGKDHGMHFPLHAGTEVVVACVNGDLNRPIILGVLPNPDTPTPVTAENPSQNILRTSGGNELLMDDRIGEERIELFTHDRENILVLDAKQDAHQVRLATEQGDMTLYAGKSMHLECGQNQNIEVGADHEVVVEDSQRLLTKQGQIEYQAATDFLLKAGENIFLTAEGQDIELRAGADVVIQSGANLSLEVLNEDMSVLIDQGDFQLQAAGAITIKGQGGGPIRIEQGGGVLEITPDGDLTIDAPSVEINANKIAIKAQEVGNN